MEKIELKVKDSLNNYFKKGDTVYLVDFSYVHTPGEEVVINDFIYTPEQRNYNFLKGQPLIAVSDSYIDVVCFNGEYESFEFIDAEYDGEIFAVLVDNPGSACHDWEEYDLKMRFDEEMEKLYEECCPMTFEEFGDYDNDDF